MFVISSTGDRIHLDDRSLAGISLTGGILTGLGNLVRTDSAVLDKRFVRCVSGDRMMTRSCRADKLYLAFTLELSSLVVDYCWDRRQIRLGGGRIRIYMFSVIVYVRVSDSVFVSCCKFVC